MRRQKIIFAIVFLIIAVGAGYFIYRDLNYGSSTPIVDQSAAPVTRVERQSNFAGSAVSINSTSTSCSIDSGGENCNMPDLDKKIVEKNNLSGEEKIKIISEIQEIRGELKQNPNSFQNWLQLGLLYKAIGDYQGAEEVWLYAAKINPNSAVIFNNLADLYAFYLSLRDYSKAETYYKKAIKIDPRPFYYQKLYELYHNLYKEKSDLAESVLREGLKKNPNDKVLEYLLKQYLENKK